MTNRAKLILLGLLILAATMIDPLPADGLIMEDSPQWNCATMGNRICGPGHGPYAHWNEYMVFSPNNGGIIR